MSSTNPQDVLNTDEGVGDGPVENFTAPETLEEEEHVAHDTERKAEKEAEETTDEYASSEDPEMQKESRPKTLEEKLKSFLPKPRDPYASPEDAPVLPLKPTWRNMVSYVTFHWIFDLLYVGMYRPIEEDDLWRLDKDHFSSIMADKLEASLEWQKQDAIEFNRLLDSGEYKPSWFRRTWWKAQKNLLGIGDGTGHRRMYLVLGILDVFKWHFYPGLFFKVFNDLAITTAPLVAKHLISFNQEAYDAARNVPGAKEPDVGRGIAYAIVIFIMQFIGSFFIHHAFYRGLSTGVWVRATLIVYLYRHAMKLSAKGRCQVSDSQLMTHLSSDISRIDFAFGFFHLIISGISVCIIILVILCYNMGAVALSGYALMILAFPLQFYAARLMFKLRIRVVGQTDKRNKLSSELLSGMRVIKMFAWEEPYLNNLQGVRNTELGFLKRLLWLRTLVTSFSFAIPNLAMVVAFLSYSAAGNSQNASIIFSSLSEFNLLRMPLNILPMAINMTVDAFHALGRLERAFTADVIDETTFATSEADSDSQSESQEKHSPEKESSSEKPEYAVVFDHASYHWETEQTAKGEAEATALSLEDITVRVPHGQLVAVVGSIGSGKSSLLQALLGDMTQSQGKAEINGTVSYCSQSAWIKNATLRDNILFGSPYDKEKYARTLFAACLEPDLDVLPGGDMTEIGEKGITLSGGQKQRVAIARAIYQDNDIVLLDDPLSAVDAHVGKHIFDNVILGALKNKTVILVTHALHFLPKVDIVLFLDKGRLIKRGTYNELTRDADFAELMQTFGGQDKEKKEEDTQDDPEDVVEDVVPEAEAQDKDKDAAPKNHKPEAVKHQLMTTEERSTGNISNSTFVMWLKAGQGWWTMTSGVALLCVLQGVQTFSSYWLTYWEYNQFDRPNGFYMGIYAMLGVLTAFLAIAQGSFIMLFGVFVSRSLHKGALNRLIKAPMSFFDTTPLGRIMNRLSKDLDAIDNQMNESLRMSFTSFGSVLGVIVLVAVVMPWFLIAVGVVIVIYYLLYRFYAHSAREFKRLDNVLRSSVYTHFSESLSGRSTIRAYRKLGDFISQMEHNLDRENRAYILTTVNQRWISLRIDWATSILVLVIALLTVALRHSETPARIGLALSYMLSVQMMFAFIIRNFAEVENDMNSVDRLLYYGLDVPQEKSLRIDNPDLADSWPPRRGSVKFDKVVMQYRPGLPDVLKGLSISIGAGEKIGIVGRTGAGKSSIMTALYRLVELSSGSISVDDVDISKLGLNDLRENISIIPQDAVLFNGTIRSNLDPFGVHSDDDLNRALYQSWLVDSNSEDSSFSLDSAVADEGSNMSAGQRSLLSLARALVKDNRVVVLDEATASVDLITDERIQHTIKKYFKDKTLLCIAHRLRTIINYDRILVMDQGVSIEFDTPLNLFRAHGVFYEMCERSSINEQDIIQASFAGETE